VLSVRERAAELDGRAEAIVRAREAGFGKL
jgi:hypothetical protein